MKLLLLESWKLAMLDKIGNPEFEYRTAIPIAATWLVLQLAEKKYSFKVMNLGAGVKLITRKTDTCPKCHGTGRV